MIGTFFQKVWYSKNFFAYLLFPFSILFISISFIRKIFLKALFFKKNYSVPIIVVGNLNVGGTGKTPLVIYLANLLKKHGKNPGIIIRGYKKKGKGIVVVNQKTTISEIGDEAYLLYKYTKSKVVVGANRIRAVKKLLEIDKSIDVIISDDGLQHYKLYRDLEIAMCDDMRYFGNGFCLPAGPLRELPFRLKKVDFLVLNQRGIDNQSEKEITKTFNQVQTNDYLAQKFEDILKKTKSHKKLYFMQLVGNKIFSLSNSNDIKCLTDFSNKRVHAVSGIGNNESFFQKLKSHDIDVISHPFDDHHYFTNKDIEFDDDLPVIMTTKDAVKCVELSNKKIWVYPVVAKMDESFDNKILSCLKRKTPLETRINDILGKYKRKSE